MLRLKIAVGAGVAALTASLLVGSAQGAALGHPGYSANLSSNKALKQQQLLCDPDGVTAGSTSTEYSPSLSSINDVSAYTGFGITGVYIDVYDPTDDDDIDVVTAYAGPPIADVNVAGSGILTSLEQSGEVQVFWQALPDDTVKPATPSDDTFTHTLTFDYLPEDETTYAWYMNIGDPNGPNGTDYLQGYIDDELTTYYANTYPGGFGSSYNSAPLVPEPASLGLLALGAVGLLRRRP
jgi:hypothetical protein